MGIIREGGEEEGVEAEVVEEGIPPQEVGGKEDRSAGEAGEEMGQPHPLPRQHPSLRQFQVHQQHKPYHSLASQAEQLSLMEARKM